eukprot:8681867-Pyramimonas_sp.AAC.1
MIPKGVKSSSEWAIELYSADSLRDWLRQHCTTHSVDVRGQFVSGETCSDRCLCADQERGASDGECKPCIS